MKSAAIVGFGRFGELFGQLAKDEFNVAVVEQDPTRQEIARSLGHSLVDLPDIGSFDLTVIAVPISSFANTVKDLHPYVRAGQLVTDVCSVKVYPAQQMRMHLPNCQTIATHPMFGPDSAARGLSHLRLAYCPLNASPEAQSLLRNFWESKSVDVIDTTPEMHDQDAAYSQALPYIIAHVLNGMDLPDLTFTTRSSEALYDIAHYSAKDSKQLFRDMLAYNPYARAMLELINNSLDTALGLAQELASSRVDEEAQT